MSSIEPVVVRPVGIPGEGSVVARALVFKHAGRLHVVVTAKATLELIHQAPMRFVEARPFRDDDELEPTGAARAASDARPGLRRTDVTFVGHAHAPGLNPVRRMLARFAVVRPMVPGGPIDGGIPLLDKSIGVIGQRFATAAQPNPFPVGFVRLPLTYALALGGASDPDNPIGVGREPDSHGLVRLPSVVPAGDAPSHGPLGYAPLPRTFPARARGLIAARVDAINELGPDFDFEAWQAAPEDQRVELLRGDEWVYLENLVPRFPRASSQLPGVFGEARVHGDAGVQRLTLRIDSLAVDGDTGHVEICATGTFSVENERALGRIEVDAAISKQGVEPRWPAPRGEAYAPANPAFAGTMVLDLTPEPAVDSAGTMVLSPDLGADSSASPGTMVLSPDLGADSSASPGTMVLSPDDAGRMREAAIAMRAALGAPAPLPTPPPPAMAAPPVGTRPGAPLQGSPLQGSPSQTLPLQGPPLQGPPLQGPPLQNPPLQGSPPPPQAGVAPRAAGGIPPAAWAAPKGAPAAQHPLASTQIVPPEAAPPAPIEEPPSTQVFSSSFERQRTMVIAPEAPPSTRAPFRLGKPKSRPGDAQPIPGAPWEEPAPAAVRPGIGQAQTWTPDRARAAAAAEEAPPETKLLPPPAPKPEEAPQKPDGAPELAPAPSKAPARKAGADLWAKPDPSQAAPPEVPKPKAVMPAPAAKKNTLYERFRKG